MPDPQRQFVGAVLSQPSEQDGKMHPCACLSRRLSKAERNYDEGNRELLAVEEWRHWLEGASQPFIVWTDHKNLSTSRKPNDLILAWSLLEFFLPTS